MEPECWTRALRAFRAFAGEERFRRFALVVVSRDRRGRRLDDWQQELLYEFAMSGAPPLPENAAQLAPHFAGDLRPFVLTAAEVPSWCGVEGVAGHCPVQGWGTWEGLPWYFRARTEPWEMTVAPDADTDPADCEPHEAAYYREGLYYGLAPDAGYMEVDEARYLIVESLRAFREERAAGSSR